MMMIPNGNFTFQSISNDQMYTLQMEFRNDHEVDCPELGRLGRYYCEDEYITMAFGYPSGTSAETDYCCFGKMVEPGVYQGIMLDNRTGETYGWEARPGGDFEATISFTSSIQLPTWPAYEFSGVVKPALINTYYRFDYSNSLEGGEVTVGTMGQNPDYTAQFTSKTFAATKEQLLVFGSRGLRVYGAVVKPLPDGTIWLEHGQYMNPFTDGNDYSGSWTAQC